MRNSSIVSTGDRVTVPVKKKDPPEASPVNDKLPTEALFSFPTVVHPVQHSMAAKLSLIATCPVCSSSDNLRRCLGCKVVSYCGRDHQVSDRDAHKHVCKCIKKAHRALDLEEQKLRVHIDDDYSTPIDLFEKGEGRFWGIWETRTYMRSRFQLVDALLEVKTAGAVEAALHHVIDLLRLSRRDNMGVRDLPPALFLRLGRDQECYDFLKWNATTGGDPNFDWGSKNLPFLDVKDADVFEPVDMFKHTILSDLSHTVSVTLLKIRLLLDVRILQNTTMGEKLPQEALDNLRDQFRSTIFVKRKDIMECKDHSALVQKLESQVKKLYTHVKSANEHFWSALLRPWAHLMVQPSSFSHGSLEEVQHTLHWVYDSLVETPGAIDVVRDLVRNDIAR